MGVEIESDIWEPNPALYIFLFVCCCLSIFYLPARATASNVFDHASSASFLRFQRNFLVLFALSSVLEGSRAVFGEYEFAIYKLTKDQMVNTLCIGYAASVLAGSFLGVVSDLLGHKKVVLLFCILHLCTSVWKIVVGAQVIWLGTITLSVASLIFSFSFEALMVVEHNKLGQRQDSLNDMFWLMTFFECACFVGSQAIGNYLINGDVNKNITNIWKESVVVALLIIVHLSRSWKENPKSASFKDYSVLFRRHVVGDKRVWLLSWVQACIHFSTAAFWILWAPTIVADGREVSLGLLYPCLLGFKMLGCTGFPWMSHGPLATRIEEYLMYAFVVIGVALTVVAYDYQEIEFLLIIFCLLHACIGLVLPSLARLRSVCVPNEIRGGMMSLSLVPANAAVFVMLLLRGYYQCIGNSTILAIAALGQFSAAWCMYTMKKWGKQLHLSEHSL
ncbi:uncharacterized protein LOC127248640 [Andrographis paniculata]|uniref:uncharacterized protein LOC127248640 n=1 Tax=Andrographis paniculata TaxID=175694 RepID=UPI0021E95B31|nr:uncharacterized protein LOC127248640 [Andrographis paniculata]